MNELITRREGSIYRDSLAYGPIFLDRFSCIYMSTLGGFNGLGCFSYVRKSCLGRYTHIGSRSSIGGAKHPLDWASIGSFQYRPEEWGISINTEEFDEGPGVIIGNDVWIGDNTVVLGGVKIGTGAVIGAGSIVTKDIEDYSICIGCPARKLRDRFPSDIKEALLASMWWEKSPLELNGLPFKDPKEFIVSYQKRFLIS